MSTSPKNQLYAIRTDLLSNREVFQRWLDTVPEKRRQKVLSCGSSEGKFRSLAAGILEYVAIQRWGEGEYFLNLSHTCDIAVCAISDRPVGVDVEGRRKMGDKVVMRVFSPYEIEAIMQSEEPFDIGFIRLWTAKESIVKYTKEGLSHGLDDIEIDPGSYRIRKCTGIDVENVYLSRFEADGYYITVCSQYEQFCKAISIPEIQ